MSVVCKAQARPLFKPTIKSTFRSSAAFTLAEVLVTLVVFSLILVVASSGLQSGAAVWAKVDSRMERSGQVAMSGQVLSGLFDRAYATGTIPGLDDLTTKENSAERFLFIHYSPPWPDDAGYVLVELRIEDGAEGQTLDLIRSSLTFGEGSDAKRVSTKTSRLIEGADQIAFSYLEQDRMTGAPTWKGSWSDPDILPKRVRLAIDKDGRGVDLGFELNNVMAPECLVGGRDFRCEVRR
jgi:prepilin-type N-terminal cleavage/methylation domain-containing protein